MRYRLVMSIPQEELIRLAGLEKKKPVRKSSKKKVKSKLLPDRVEIPPSVVAESRNEIIPERGRKTEKEHMEDLVTDLKSLGIDPLKEMVEILYSRDGGDGSIDDKTRLTFLDKLVEKAYAKKKSVEKKETHDYTFNIVTKKFKQDENGEVIDV